MQRERELVAFPHDPADAHARWSRERDALTERVAAPVPMTEAFALGSSGDETPRTHQLNFLSLLLCLSIGTASLPHILTRYNTTTSVASARRSVGWTLFFVALFYLTVPVLAALIKHEILTGLVGHRFADLPQWVCAVKRWRFLAGASPARLMLQPQATGAAMEVTKWLKPPVRQHVLSP